MILPTQVGDVFYSFFISRLLDRGVKPSSIRTLCYQLRSCLEGLPSIEPRLVTPTQSLLFLITEDLLLLLLQMRYQGFTTSISSLWLNVRIIVRCWIRQRICSSYPAILVNAILICSESRRRTLTETSSPSFSKRLGTGLLLT